MNGDDYIGTSVMALTPRDNEPRRLVIISVPFVRIARVSLSELVLGVLRRDSDVVIVAPFAGSADFQQNFGGLRTHFVQWKMNPLGRPHRFLYAASEIMRRHGYWRRFRKDGMAYHVRNALVEFDRDGNDIRIGGLRGGAFWLLGVLGQWSAAWRGAERAMGTAWCACPPLEQMAQLYEQVTLLQSANWGDQDRALARLSRRKTWRRVLLPYTVDQLDVNGFLVNEYDAICVQGPFEADRARRLHGIAEAQISRLGSAWLRHLYHIRGHDDRGFSLPNSRGVVMYAGASSTYFPRASELAAVQAIAKLLRESYTHLRLVYRPVEDDPAVRAELERTFAEVGVSVQWPASTEIGLEHYSGEDYVASLRKYARGMEGCKLLVTSNITSLMIDVAALQRCGVVSNRVDPSGVMERRHTQLLSRTWFSSVPIARSMSDLLSQIQLLLDTPADGESTAQALVSAWDYPDSDFERLLVEAVHGGSACVEQSASEATRRTAEGQT